MSETPEERVETEIEDVEGHQRHRAIEEDTLEQDDVEGHQAKFPHADESRDGEDDVEGHQAHR